MLTARPRRNANAARLVIRAGAGATAIAAASVLLTGCAGAEPEPSTAGAGPQGYMLAADLGDGHQFWYDRGEESALTDIVIDDEQGMVIAACLGAGPLMCVSGPDDASGMLVIAPKGAERAVANWYGEEVELKRGTGPEGDAPPVFGGVMPPRAAEGEAKVQVLNGAGEAIWP